MQKSICGRVEKAKKFLERGSYARGGYIVCFGPLRVAILRTGAMCIIMLKNVKRGSAVPRGLHTLVVNNAIKDTRAIGPLIHSIV